MVEAYKRIDEIDPKKCVEVAVKRFGPAQMADGYEAVYDRAMQFATYSEPIS